MKKLMVAAAIALVAVCSQAASLKWSASAVNAVDANGNVLTANPRPGYDVVLAYLGTTDNWSYNSAVEVPNTKSGAGGVTKWSIGEEDDAKYAYASGEFNGSSVVASGLANDQVYAVMLRDGDGNLSQLTYADGALDTITYTITDYSGSTWSKSFQFATGKNYVVGAVPEPTSGLLLLLGVAGLALRRRRA